MKNMRKIVSMLLALVMVLGLATTAFAQEVDSKQNGAATITISNASKGETYRVVKLFDAAVTGEDGGSIAYTGEIPTELTNYFTKHTQGNISAAEAAVESDGKTLTPAAVNAITDWAKTQTAVATAECTDGASLTFTGLEFGYYVVISSQGAVVTVTSTNPNATIVDKNTVVITADKTVDDISYSIGDTITYTATFKTTNWDGEGTAAKKVVKYVIEDTLPNFLSDVRVTSIVVDEDGKADTTNDQTPLTIQQFVNKQITIDWVDTSKDRNHLYDNGAYIILTYTAKLTKDAVIDGTGNTNEVTIEPYYPDDDGDGEDDPSNKKIKDTETVWTYAAALEKVDEKSAPLAGAKFRAKGLKVTGEAGNYTVVSYDDAADAAWGDIMETDANGRLIIKGLKATKDTQGAINGITLTMEEHEAPAGYNKIVGTFTLKPFITDQTVTATTKTTYYDADGNVTNETTETYTKVTEFNQDLTNRFSQLAQDVVNNKGTELPETGGMGTTLFYVIGGILMMAAVVLLVTKKRVNAD